MVRDWAPHYDQAQSRLQFAASLPLGYARDIFHGTVDCAMTLSLRCPKCREPLWLTDVPEGASVPCRYCGADVPLPHSPQPIDPGPTPAANPYRDEVFWSASSTPPEDLANPYAPPAYVDAPLASARYAVTSKALARSADLSDRFFAALIDGVLGFLAAIVAVLIGYALLFLRQRPVGEDSLLIPAYVGIFGLHIVQCIYIVQRGQSLGKMAMGIRLANYQNDAIPDFGRSVVVRIWLTNLIAAVVPFFGLIDILVIFAAGSRCIHDMMAGTRVIALRDLTLRRR